MKARLEPDTFFHKKRDLEENLSKPPDNDTNGQCHDRWRHAVEEQKGRGDHGNIEKAWRECRSGEMAQRIQNTHAKCHETDEE